LDRFIKIAIILLFMFCPKCGSLLIPKNRKLSCSCGYIHNDKITFNTKHDTSNKIVIREKDSFESLPKTDEECPECGNNEAYFGTQQTGPSDEAEITIFKCTKCKHTWRNTNHPY